MINDNVYRDIWLKNKWKTDALHEENDIYIHVKDQILDGLKLMFIEANQIDHPYEQILMHTLGFCHKNIKSRKKNHDKE